MAASRLSHATIAAPATRAAPVRASRDADATGTSGAVRRTMVTPFARALAVLGAFSPGDRWLGNRDLAERTGLPASTVTRLAQSLVALGYLLHAPAERKYRLSAAVLALGYAAIANSEVQRVARAQMQAFADQHRVHTSLSARDRLDLIVLESCTSPHALVALNLHVGARAGIASSPMGWALLSAVPEVERDYLLANVERRMPREWPRLRRRLNEALAQIRDRGWCSSIGEWDRALGIVAAPVVIDGHEPRVLSCVGASLMMSRARVERELGPHLLAMTRAIQPASTPR
jgi:DNA-binding IclR family transcriptional regulator